VRPVGNCRGSVNLKTMNKEEAIQQMKKGVKITHQYFSSDEWMTMEGNKIVLEDSVRCSEREFWHWRKNAGWETGYSVYKGK